MTVNVRGQEGQMHAIIANSKPYATALAALETAERNQEIYADKVAKARAEYEAAQRAALDRGETHSPRLEVIDDDQVRRHLADVQSRAEVVYGTAVKQAAPRLIAAVEAREAELLRSVEKLKVADLKSIAAEIGELAAARGFLQQAVKFRDATRPLARSAGSAVPVSAGKVLDAALTGSTVIGRTPIEPEPDREVMAFGQIRIRGEDEKAGLAVGN